ncbi:MAG: DUF1326 domain-containing protein [Myxococcota bacterium]
MIEWSIRGPAFANCNCDYGCPCQFNALPTHGNCEALAAMRIDQGHFGDVRLDGLCWVNTYSWPGAVHEGNGTHQSIIDERADEKQRAALVEILHGRESEEGANVFQVYASTMSTVLDPLFRPIEFSCDIEGRKARLVVPELIESTVGPIRNPVTGDEHRVSIRQPEGFEYTEAEMGSGTSSARAGVPMELSESYVQLTTYHLTHKGVVR